MNKGADERLRHDASRQSVESQGFRYQDPGGQEVAAEDFLRVINYKDDYVQRKLGKFKKRQKNYRKGARENWDDDYKQNLKKEVHKRIRAEKK